MAKLAGKTAVVTGGSSGIGLAVARRFVAEGAHVYIVGRRIEPLEEAKSQIGEGVSIFSGDISAEGDMEELYARIRAERGVVHAVVANASIVGQERLDETSLTHFNHIFDINVRGTFLTVQKALPLMTEKGSIVIVSSGQYKMGVPGASAYAASKAAQRSFARTWSAELIERGIRVNTLVPGTIDTPVMDVSGASPEVQEAIRQLCIRMTPLGRLGSVEEMASAALFLASEESSFCLGMELVADGGMTDLPWHGMTL